MSGMIYNSMTRNYSSWICFLFFPKVQTRLDRFTRSNYNTKNMKNLHVQKLQLEHAKRSLLYRDLNAWNSTSEPFRNVENCTILGLFI